MKVYDVVTPGAGGMGDWFHQLKETLVATVIFYPRKWNTLQRMDVETTERVTSRLLP